MRSVSLSAVVAATLATAAVGAHAAPLTNGSLESTAGGFIQTVPGFTSANSWSVGSVNIEFVKAGYSSSGDTVGAARDGEWFVDLNGTQGAGRISQIFDTVPGQWYRIDYWISGNAGPNGATTADGSKSLNALWNGSTADSATYLHQSGDNWSNMRWEGHSFLAQASGISSTLAFQSTSTFYSAAGPFIDSISVTAVPEPATLALWLAGIGIVSGAVRRRG